MHPVSILIAFVFLGMMVIVGLQLVVMSSRRMAEAHNPSLGFQVIVRPFRVFLRMTLYSMLLILGLFLAAEGGLGIYRLIWAV